ncbi:hypothetical protein CWO08_23305 [Vibrio sp. 10N.286.48.B8]|uniref:OmpA family protein n=1 Tax=unclassified Vibrio TaxID=2614977 RepID=UPI0007EEB6F5|nr:MULTISPECIES: OmpA family protein [unclassified Vibrio]MCP4956795.1 OmpA family protein [Photobacterium aquimaris]OBS92772.1 hypothetical protein A9261_21945 [Vibrio tasmaniensis]CAK3908417.1 OmpA-like domain-containing protein [Vibrio crassostreae]PTO87890.1 hypothetical protein CWO08_23305 [Vibrio sp. 10N.286.48.B8]PTQ04522.1 hypothetical protein CWO13_09725 [Vibrio sp. ZF 223]
MKLQAVAIGLMLSSGTSAAQNINEDTKHLDDKSGIWVGANLGVGFVDSSDIEDGENTAPSTKIELGYDINRNFGVYGSYDYLSNLDNSDLHLGTIGIKGNYYFTDYFSMFGKIGATYVSGENNIKDDNFSGTAGLGFEYQLTNSVTTKIGYDYYDQIEKKSGQDFHLNQVYWGMTYKFGQPSTPLVLEKEKIVEKEIVETKEIIKTRISRTEYILPYQVGEVEINDYGRYNLNEVARVMLDNPSLKANVIGRTDSLGSDKVNKKISEKRADSVALLLINQGVDSSRINTSSVSNEQPLSSQENGPLERSVQVILK